MPDVKKLLLFTILGFVTIVALFYVSNPNIINDIANSRKEMGEKDVVFSELNEETGIPTAALIGFMVFLMKIVPTEKQLKAAHGKNGTAGIL